MELLKNFFKDESGQGLVEYALIIALIAVVAVVAITTLGTRISSLFTSTATHLPS